MGEGLKRARKLTSEGYRAARGVAPRPEGAPTPEAAISAGREPDRERIALVLKDGEWVTPVPIPAGSALHWWDGAPKVRAAWTDGFEILEGKVAPHVHLAPAPPETDREERLRAIETTQADHYETIAALLAPPAPEAKAEAEGEGA